MYIQVIITKSNEDIKKAFQQFPLKVKFIYNF